MTLIVNIILLYVHAEFFSLAVCRHKMCVYYTKNCAFVYIDVSFIFSTISQCHGNCDFTSTYMPISFIIWLRMSVTQ